MQDTIRELLGYAKRNQKAVNEYGEFYFTPTSVAAQLGVAPKTVWRWIKSGELIAYKFGRIYRIPESALRVFLDLNCTASHAAPDD